MGGQNNTPNINNVAVLNPVQFALLYHKKVIDKIIFPREVYNGQSQMLSHLQMLNISIDDVYIAGRLDENINVYNLDSRRTLISFINLLMILE